MLQNLLRIRMRKIREAQENIHKAKVFKTRHIWIAMSCSEQNNQIKAVSRNPVSVGREGSFGLRRIRDTKQGRKQDSGGQGDNGNFFK